ncbi:MAG: LysR family transcriptional regulator [Alphaproteobacteria bacterium]|nr:LysR family transcriptional regulator [Alphaproteobacteria bacterium]
MHYLLDNRVRSRLRLRHLQLLDALGETLNIHKAAPRLNLSQPATSKLLHELEELYRTPLFFRQPRGVRPTAAGEVAIRRARLVLHEIGDAIGEARLVASGASGRVRLGALPVAIATLFQRVLAEVHAVMPRLVIDVTEGPLDGLLASLKRNELDVVLARLTGETRHPSFVTEPLYAESVSLVVRPSHPLAKKRRITMSDLAKQGWILPPVAAPVRQEIDRNFQQRGLPGPPAWIETTSLLLTETAIAQSDLVAAMPHGVARLYQSRGQLRILKAGFTVRMPQVGIVRRATDLQAPHVERFLTVLRKSARDG